jgi:serine/threonine protein kinase
VAQRSGGWGFLSWFFGAGARPGPRKIAHQVTAQYDLDRLKELGILGHGAYGSVRLVKDAATGQVMALKSVSKGMTVEAGLQEAIMTEKAVMQSTSSPFLVKLAACFDRDQDLFFLLEAATGGDLYTVYRWKDLFGSEAHARFYMACMTCAFEHLHGRGILYRDLKMENVVLDSRGYAKLCDFGTSTFADRAFTMCGTPEYMAPEVFSGSGHGSGADWWTLGVLGFEMMMAQTPFMDADPLQIFRKAKEGIDKVEMPEDKHWASLVKGLCRLNPIQRLPMLPNGLEQFRSQEWWSDFDWGSLEAQTMIPPHVPTLKGPDDLHNFNCEGQDQPARLTFHDWGEGWFEDFEDTVGPALHRDGAPRPGGQPLHLPAASDF